MKLLAATSLLFICAACEAQQAETLADTIIEVETAERETPIVGKFARNIYKDEYFRESVYYDNLSAFWTGYNMQSYLYAGDCLDKYTGYMDSFHTWYLTATRYKKKTELSDLAFTVAGTDANDSWYNCYLFYYDFSKAYEQKFEKFNDFGDIYLSFIFNMLQNSLSIKKQTENMIESYAKHDTVTFTRSLGSVLRSILDFNMYTSQAGSLEEPSSVASFLGQSPVPEQPKFERKAAMDKKLAQSRERIDRKVQEMEVGWDEKEQKVAFKVNHEKLLDKRARENAVGPEVGLAEDYEWKFVNYVLAPVGFTVGALGALPSDTDGPACSLNANYFRSYTLAGRKLAEEESELDDKDDLLAIESYHRAGSYIDEMGVKCTSSIVGTLDTAYWNSFFGAWYTKLPVNLAYNAGYMWVDAVNYIYYQPSTLEDGDWAYFVSYLAGDFSLRFFYHDPTPQRVDV